MEKKLTLFTVLIFGCLLFVTNFLTTQTVEVNLKVFMEGPYNGMGMNTTLDLSTQLTHPYSSVHTGDEEVAVGFFAIHPNILDWILVELRDKDDNSQVVKRRAAFLLNDGQIVDLAGVSPVAFDVVNSDYYVSVYHRNHLSILSSDIVYRSTCPGTPKVYYEGGPNNDNDGDGDYYTIVQIATQCWLRENLNVGEKINWLNIGDNQTNNSVIERYCYSNILTNCTTYGALYQWNEAMQYVSTLGAQGICPSGWHIPTDLQFQTLINEVSGSSSKLEATGTNTSGFSALFAGNINSFNGQFNGQGFSINIWLSEESFGNAGNYYMNNFDDDIDYLNRLKNNGHSVRCLKD
ncbi:MAG: FISUMP domain-containing protein [Melioribacteraceae bacterium]